MYIYIIFHRDRDLFDFRDGTYSRTDLSEMLALVKEHLCPTVMEKNDYGTEYLWVKNKPPTMHSFVLLFIIDWRKLAMCVSKNFASICIN